jgi:hypothetical protein
MLRPVPGDRQAVDAIAGDRRGVESRPATVRIVDSETHPHQVAVSAVSSADLGRLRESFERYHHVKLPEFLSGELLDRTRRYMDEGEFSTRVHKGIGTELSLEQGKSPRLLLFLMNDPELFEIVRAITGCDRIGSFNGRIYRMMPREHADSWHDDVNGKRLIAMSINLSANPYSGGILELRDERSEEIVARVANTGPGDALLFRLAAGLKHRVTAVTGELPRTAYAGWFEKGPDSVFTL